MTLSPRSPLIGSHVVVIGGSSGLGLCAAECAQAAGATLTIIGRTPSRLETALRRLGNVRSALADICDRRSLEAAFARMDRVDHLVITAGSIRAGRLVDTDPDELIADLKERLIGPLYAIKAALPLMNPGSSVVLTGGQYSDRPAEGAAIVSASVRGVEALARSLALELKPIRVNVIAPGLVDTPLFDGFGSEGRAALFQASAARLPVGRTGHPEEIGEAITFLLGAGYINGEVLHVDGGGRYV